MRTNLVKKPSLEFNILWDFKVTVKYGENLVNILWYFQRKEKAKLLEEESKNEPVSDEGATTEASGTAAHNPDKPEGL